MTGTSSQTAASGTNKAALVILIAVPLILVGALFFGRSLLGGGPRAPARPNMSVFEAWPDGSPRVLTRDWVEAGISWDEFCAYDADGDELGCGLLREGGPWSGTFWEWHELPPAPEAPVTLKEERTWREGHREGTWRAYRFDGTLSVETTYENDRIASRRLFDMNGENPLQWPPKPLTDLPESRRVNTPAPVALP